MTVRELISALENGPDLDAEVWLDFPDSFDSHGPLVRLEQATVWEAARGSERYASTAEWSAEPRYWRRIGPAVLLLGGNNE